MKYFSSFLAYLRACSLTVCQYQTGWSRLSLKTSTLAGEQGLKSWWISEIILWRMSDMFVFARQYWLSISGRQIEPPSQTWACRKDGQKVMVGPVLGYCGGKDTSTGQLPPSQGVWGRPGTQTTHRSSRSIPFGEHSMTCAQGSWRTYYSSFSIRHYRIDRLYIWRWGWRSGEGGGGNARGERCGLSMSALVMQAEAVRVEVIIFVMSAYPPALQSVLKAAPCIVMSFYASYVFYIVMHGMTRRPQDHVPKFSYRSTKFERMVRFRDQKLRRFYLPKLTEDPNIAYSKSINSHLE